MTDATGTERPDGMAEEVTREELIALLLKVEGNRPDSLGICTQWHRNPEGPQAVAALTTAEADIAALREEVERWKADYVKMLDYIDALRPLLWGYDLRARVSADVAKERAALKARGGEG